MLLNAFSLSMVETPAQICATEINAQEARAHLLALAEEAGETELIQFAVGHADTAAVFETILDLPVTVNRINVRLKPGDKAIVGQYTGPRLPEGARALPEGAQIRWLAIAIA